MEYFTILNVVYQRETNAQCVANPLTFSYYALIYNKLKRFLALIANT